LQTMLQRPVVCYIQSMLSKSMLEWWHMFTSQQSQ